MQKRREKRKVWFNELRHINKAFPEAYVGLRSAENYRPLCLGGMEDRMAGISQYLNQIYWLEQERGRLARLLRMSQSAAARFE